MIRRRKDHTGISLLGFGQNQKEKEVFHRRQYLQKTLFLQQQNADVITAITKKFKHTWLAATLIRTCCPHCIVSEKDALIGTHCSSDQLLKKLFQFKHFKNFCIQVLSCCTHPKSSLKQHFTWPTYVYSLPNNFPSSYPSLTTEELLSLTSSQPTIVTLQVIDSDHLSLIKVNCLNTVVALHHQ